MKGEKSVGGTRPTKATADAGFRGVKEVEGIAIVLPTNKEKQDMDNK